MDISEFLESEFVTVELVENAKNKNAVVQNSGIRENTQYGVKPSFTVVFGEKLKRWRPNKKSLKNISDKWGNISDTWAGSVIEFRIEFKENTTEKIVVAYPVKKFEIPKMVEEKVN